MRLPSLKDGQDWCCGGCGSGIVKTPEKTHFEYSREELPNGDVISNTTVRYIAPCCGGELMLWDESRQDYIRWQYEATAAKPGPQNFQLQDGCPHIMGESLPAAAADADAVRDARLAGMEEAASICEGMQAVELSNTRRHDMAYNQAIKDNAQAIRAAMSHDSKE